VAQIYAYRHSEQWGVAKFKTMFDRLTYQDQVEVMKYKRWQDRESHLIGRLLWVLALEKREYLHAKQIVLSEFGRPVWPLSNGDANLSHSGEWVLLAITDRGFIGIDIEKKVSQNIDEFKSGFSRIEWEMITTSKGEILEDFYTLWTQKEAVLKAEGRGWSNKPDAITWKDNTGYIGVSTYSLVPIAVSGDYACHIAVNMPVPVSVKYTVIQKL
jgi:4'-phosphopantetheinyl transferase